MRAVLIAICAAFFLPNAPMLHAQETKGLCDNPRDASNDRAVAVATKLFDALTSAYESLTAEYGDDALSGAVMEHQTENGIETIGEIWGRFLTESGYPSDIQDRQNCVQLLGEFGLDDSGMTVLVLPNANIDWIEHLMANLRRIKGGS